MLFMAALNVNLKIPAAPYVAAMARIVNPITYAVSRTDLNLM